MSLPEKYTFTGITDNNLGFTKKIEYFYRNYRTQS